VIVVTVGTQLPFDRLIKMVDDIAPSLEQEIFAQTGLSRFRPTNYQWQSSVEASEFDKKLAASSVIISHAGIGTVLKAYKYTKPIILVPRKSSLGEHRNDHQTATASKLAGRTGIYIAETTAELSGYLKSQLQPAIAGSDVEESKNRLRGFIRQTVLQALAT
jgi:UDP-N-acetylglucosamine transferase subunit ALG13